MMRLVRCGEQAYAANLLLAGLSGPSHGDPCPSALELSFSLPLIRSLVLRAAPADRHAPISAGIPLSHPSWAPTGVAASGSRCFRESRCQTSSRSPRTSPEGTGHPRPAEPLFSKCAQDWPPPGLRQAGAEGEDTRRQAPSEGAALAAEGMDQQVRCRGAFCGKTSGRLSFLFSETDKPPTYIQPAAFAWQTCFKRPLELVTRDDNESKHRSPSCLAPRVRSSKLHRSLEGYQPEVPLREQHLGLWASVLNSLGGNGGGGGGGADESETSGHAPKGVYMHGGVGTGKTFMMDLFYEVKTASS